MGGWLVGWLFAFVNKEAVINEFVFAYHLLCIKAFELSIIYIYIYIDTHTSL